MKIIESEERRWHFLAGLIQHENINTFVEVGAKDGRTTGFVLEQCPDVVVTAIDPWRAMPEHAGRADGETYEDWDFAAIEADFWKHCGKNRHRVKQLRLTSLEAAERFVEGSCGLVFIDAAHDFENAVADIRAWWPKVKPCGLLTGHDYQHAFPSVMRAVAQEFCLMDVGCGVDSVWFVRKGTRREQVAQAA